MSTYYKISSNNKLDVIKSFNVNLVIIDSNKLSKYVLNHDITTGSGYYYHFHDFTHSIHVWYGTTA